MSMIWIRGYSMQYHQYCSNPIQSNPIQSNPIQSNPIQSNCGCSGGVLHTSFQSYVISATARWKPCICSRPISAMLVNARSSAGLVSNASSYLRTATSRKKQSVNTTPVVARCATRHTHIQEALCCNGIAVPEHCALLV
jgi:hypothetical protein